jgi:hypothetical protein
LGGRQNILIYIVVSLERARILILTVMVEDSAALMGIVIASISLSVSFIYNKRP